MIVVGRFGDPRLALDLGTGKTRLASLDEPILAEVPSIVHSAPETWAAHVARRAQRPRARVVVDTEDREDAAPQIRAGRGDSP
jgi:hypothetical protein